MTFLEINVWPFSLSKKLRHSQGQEVCQIRNNNEPDEIRWLDGIRWKTNWLCCNKEIKDRLLRRLVKNIVFPISLAHIELHILSVRHLRNLGKTTIDVKNSKQCAEAPGFIHWLFHIRSMGIKTKIYNILGKRKNLEKNICTANKYL